MGGEHEQRRAQQGMRLHWEFLDPEYCQPLT
jgi:hypothetical protein